MKSTGDTEVNDIIPNPSGSLQPGGRGQQGKYNNIF